MATEKDGRWLVDCELKRSLIYINKYLVEFGPDKEMELLYDYIYKKLWKIKT